jgi:hypothetical protein
MGLGRTAGCLLPPCARQGVPQGQAESGRIVIAAEAGPRVPRGGVTRQGVVLSDFQSLVVCQ